jgi:hypothetical protein
VSVRFLDIVPPLFETSSPYLPRERLDRFLRSADPAAGITSKTLSFAAVAGQVGGREPGCLGLYRDHRQVVGEAFWRL